MNQQQVNGTIRTILTAAAGIAVGKGWISANDSVNLIGLAVPLLALAWSWVEKKAA